VQQNIDMESYRIQQTGSGRIVLNRKAGILDPQGTKGRYGLPTEEIETLSRIIAELNERFGLNLGPEHRVTLSQMMEKLDGDPALDAAARVNTRENVRLTFNHKVEGRYPGDRRHELRTLQANYRRPARPPQCRRADQAR
jgi:type I restriction enzyme, R subunit